MTTTTPTGRGVAPTQAEIDSIRSWIERDGGEFRYPIVTGTLRHVVQQLAHEHRACRAAHCLACDELRLGLAAIAALDAHNTTFNAIFLGGVA